MAKRPQETEESHYSRNGSPSPSEGWKKRATTYYLMEEYEKSLADREVVIRLNPYHYGALSGFGLIYAALDKPEKAIEYFEKALKVNPNLDSVKANIQHMQRRLRDKQRNSARGTGVGGAGAGEGQVVRARSLVLSENSRHGLKFRGRGKGTRHPEYPGHRPRPRSRSVGKGASSES